MKQHDEQLKLLREVYLGFRDRRDEELRDVVLDAIERGWVRRHVSGGYELVVPHKEWPKLLAHIKDAIYGEILDALLQRLFGLAPPDPGQKHITLVALPTIH